MDPDFSPLALIWEFDPDWPTFARVPENLYLIAHRVACLKADIHKFVASPINDGRAQSKVNNTRDALRSITELWEFYKDATDHDDIRIRRTLTAIRGHAEPVLSKWTLLASAYPATLPESTAAG